MANHSRETIMIEEDIIQYQMDREAEDRFWEELRADDGGDQRPRVLAASAASGGGAPQPSLDLGREDF